LTGNGKYVPVMFYYLCESGMTENLVSNELIYQVLMRIQNDVSTTKHDISDLKFRMHSVEEHVSALVTGSVGTNHRLDVYGERFERIETRLGLIEA
jgi:hypothetical protein